MRILVLSAAPNIDATKSIVKAAKKRGHEVEVKHPGHLLMLISDSINGYDRIYDGFEHENKPERVHSKDYDAIIPRLGSDLSYGCAIVRHLNENLNIFSTQTADGIRVAADKLLSQQKLSAAGVRTPKTVIGNRSIFPDWMIKQVGNLPAIAKELTGSQGKTVYPLESNYQTNVFLKNFNKKKKNLLIQGFIDGNSKDIRAIVIDGKVIAAMERTAAKGELRANISQGGSGKKIELSKEDQEMCVKAARACGHEVAGVDLIKNKDGLSYVLEVNSNYGYEIEEITGVDVSTPLIEYCEQNYRDGNHANAKTMAVNLFDQRVQMIYGSLDLYLQKMQLEIVLGEETKEGMAVRLANLKKAAVKLRL
jgi:ribosomal protein S6--L-glutamate ligase